MEEKILIGGSLNQTVKIGDIVHKTSKGHPMVREYLLYLEEEGMQGVPRFLGLDEQGRDMFSYLPGKTMGPDYTPDHPCLHSDECVIDTARFMRKLHDMSQGFLPRAIEAGWTNPYFPKETPEIICHGDAHIWNFVYVNGRVSGLFDFEQAYPGTRYWELAGTICMIAFPFYVNYNAAAQAGQAKRQIKLFFDEYGMSCPTNLMEITVNRLLLDMLDTACRVNAGDDEAISIMKRGDFNHYMRFAAHIKTYGHEWV